LGMDPKVEHWSEQMKIELQPGESVVVTFAESDGEITVAFTTEEIYVDANLPDSDGKAGRIYSERYAEAHHKEMIEAIARGKVELPAPSFDPSMYRMTPEQKAFTDKRTADNLRFKFGPKLDGWTDTQVADAHANWLDQVGGTDEQYKEEGFFEYLGTGR